MNEKQQKSTIPAATAEPVNPQIGLTALQEKCAVLLAAGTSITDTASALNLDRGTIYRWQKKITFTCYLNRLQAEAKEVLEGSLFEMKALALKALKEALSSPNEALKLKAATWLLERLASLPVGTTEPKEVIRKICQIKQDWWYMDSDKYNRMLEQEGLEPDE